MTQFEIDAAEAMREVAAKLCQDNVWTDGELTRGEAMAELIRRLPLPAALTPYVRPASAEELAERLELSGRPNLAFDLIVIEAFARIQYDRGRADEMMAQRLANYTAGSYVRPAAEIREEIERRLGTGEKIDALLWALGEKL